MVQSAYESELYITNRRKNIIQRGIFFSYTDTGIVFENNYC
jgi:hypothetical protein